jgi:hypothetical protein
MNTLIGTCSATTANKACRRGGCKDSNDHSHLCITIQWGAPAARAAVTPSRVDQSC